MGVVPGNKAKVQQQAAIVAHVRLCGILHQELHGVENEPFVQHIST